MNLHRVIAEPVVSRVLVGDVVVQYIISIGRPACLDPLMHALIEDALLGELVIDFLLCWVLILSVGLLALREVMLMVMIIMSMVATTATDCLGDKTL
jgi:hypothetical protein